MTAPTEQEKIETLEYVIDKLLSDRIVTEHDIPFWEHLKGDDGHWFDLDDYLERLGEMNQRMQVAAGVNVFDSVLHQLTKPSFLYRDYVMNALRIYKASYEPDDFICLDCQTRWHNAEGPISERLDELMTAIYDYENDKIFFLSVSAMNGRSSAASNCYCEGCGNNLTIGTIYIDKRL